jgi:hypothetical protein
MKIGFTGTRFGMTDSQKKTFSLLLRCLKPTDFFHGDCVGADNEAATIYNDLYGPNQITVYPPVDNTHRAHNKSYGQCKQPQTHLARNRSIVNDCDTLIVCPFNDQHQTRGGTWYTFDYALSRQGKMIIIIWPNGKADVKESVHPAEIKEEVQV